MSKRFASLSSTIVLALGIAAFAGSALAGNGAGGAAASAAPAQENASGGSGNSENAPGQLKKDSASTQATGGGSVDQNSGTQAV